MGPDESLGSPSSNFHLQARRDGVSCSDVDSLSPDELARYSRHLLLQEIGREGQQRLKASRVLVVGAGGLGSPAALYLAAAGVGTLGIADFDRVESHNLQRQLLHSDQSVGTSKVKSAGERLRATNPYIHIVEHDTAVTEENAVTLFSSYDVIVDGTDTFATRYLNNDAAVLARRPLVYGSVYKFEGSVSVFSPATGGPCYRCLFTEPPAAGTVPNCAEAGVLGALCGVIGSLQALETIKWCTQAGNTLQGQFLTFDGLRSSFRSLKVPRDPQCPVCGLHPTIQTLDPRRYRPACERTTFEHSSSMSSEPTAVPIELSVTEASQLLGNHPGSVTLIDVREPFETEICTIAGAKLIPMREIPAKLSELPKNRHLLILCHHGGRSLRVTEFLRQNGFDQVSNVTGGIDAWADQVDTRLRRY